MSYNINHSDPSYQAIVVPDGGVNNTSTSLTFIGKNYTGYSQKLGENFLHLLENFASPSAPSHPTLGQLWYDTNTNSPTPQPQLKIWDGIGWVASGNVKKNQIKPTTAVVGDLWVDTIKQQLYLWSGSAWILVGPQYSSGAESGPLVQIIADSNNTNHSIINFLVNGISVAIIATEAFTPKITIRGFENASLKVGFNVSPNYASWGLSEKASALVVNGTTVAASNFLRSDADSVTSNKLTIQNARGLTIGVGSSTVELKQDAGVVLSNNDSTNNKIFLRVRAPNGDGLNPLSIVGSTVGINKTSPTAALDVTGDIASSTSITAGTTLSVGTTLTVASTSTLGDDTTINGQLYLNWIDGAGNPKPGPAVLPSTDSVFDIGSTGAKFNKIYANNFYGTFNGNLSSNSTIQGSISGSANSLTSPTNFRLVGDITSNTVSFNGTGGTAEFTTTLDSTFINTKTLATDSYATDLLVVSRPGVGLLKTTKQSFLSNIATVPVGSIFPWAGDLTDPTVTLPSGYLLCDGSEQLVTNYPQLFAVIKYTYKALGLLKGQSTFALPDLRGRFPLGPDSMNNGTTVKSVIDGTNITTIAAMANRVTDVSADQVGSSAGHEQVTLSTQNLPDHKHDLKGTNPDTNLKGNQYYAIRPSAVSDVADIETVSNLNLGPTEADTAQYLPNSGGVDANGGNLSVPVNTMNPYQTINYIIFTGAIV